MIARACTIVSVSHLAQARVLARSFLGAHPAGEVVVLVTDDPDGELVEDAREPFRVVRPAWLDLESSEFDVMAGIYDAMELATSLKPWLMRRLLEESRRPLLYLDSDIEVFAPLDDLLELAEHHGVVLTPHLLTPLPRDGLRPTAAGILGAGIYNAGFVGAGPRALSSGFFEFWCEQLARDALVDQPNMLFADQRWLDFIDCFGHIVIRDATINLAYWNAWAYSLTLDRDQVLVDGRPLRFFHFSGFDPEEPQQLSRHQNRIVLGDEPALAWLCRNRVAALLDEGQDDCARVPYGWGRSGELVLDRTLRRAYREAVLRAERTGQPRPPSPFAEDKGGEFLGWITESRVLTSEDWETSERAALLERLRIVTEARIETESRLGAAVERNVVAEARAAELAESLRAIHATKTFRFFRYLRRIYGSTPSHRRSHRPAD